AHEVMVEPVEWAYENLETATKGQLSSMADYLARKGLIYSIREFDLVINLPMRGGGARRVSSFVTQGYRTRRMAVDFSVPLVTDVKCAKLLVEALRLIGGAPDIKTHVDCVTSRRIVKLPGLIDIHVHVREPGATHKEDWTSCTAAALAGGVTLICAMPNTQPPVTDVAAFSFTKELASRGARCDYAIFVGASCDNHSSVAELAPRAAALKMYLNETFSSLTLDDTTTWLKLKFRNVRLFAALFECPAWVIRFQRDYLPVMPHAWPQGSFLNVIQSPYSPDLAPFDFWLFSKLKSLLKGRRFQTVDEIKENVTRQLMKIPKEDFADCFEKWKGRWEKCVRFQGGYFEGD
ncbi:CAD protein-like, partial [Homarus americanus]|uniref:CAD protein-like n=1 Tax=Homarus americanus TaxID=6706 RepID=UPI001C4553C1